jgi:uncharacterized protein (TIGR02145 family)
MKKFLTIFFLHFILFSNAQQSFFRGNNSYQAPIIFAPSISSTTAISNITRYTASSGGNITDNGGAPILNSGVCWSTTSNTPTISDNKTTDGNSIGNFTSLITGLTAGVTYYVRAYASNSAGTNYGPVQTFTSTSTAIIPSIGSNLGGGKVAYVYQNGDPGYTSTNIPVLIAATADQVGNLSGGTVYWSINGASTTAQSVNLIGTNFEALGAGAANTTAIINSYGLGNYAAKLARTYTDGTYSDWSLPSLNELAKLYLNRTAIGGFVPNARYWSSTESTYPQQNFVPAISWNFNSGALNVDTKAWNLLVRAVRTITINPSTTPVLATTTTASSITTNSANVGGNVNDEGMTQVSARGFVFGTSTGSSTYSVTVGSGAGTFTTTLTGLTTGTTYYVRSFATNAQGTTYGTEINFTPTLILTTVTIGSQIWTDKNLAVTTYRNGDPIIYAANTTDWNAATNAGIGAWCYYLWDSNNGPIYGKLYNWFAVNDSRGLAPIGYHVPTAAEYTILASNSGSSLQSITSEWGANIGTNSTGFSGLPGGNNDITLNNQFEDKGTSG